MQQLGCTNATAVKLEQTEIFALRYATDFGFSALARGRDPIVWGGDSIPRNMRIVA